MRNFERTNFKVNLKRLSLPPSLLVRLELGKREGCYSLGFRSTMAVKVTGEDYGFGSRQRVKKVR